MHSCSRGGTSPSAFVLFVPRLVAATIIFAGGFLIALIVRRAIQRLLDWMDFDRLTLRSGASEMLRLAEMPTAEVLIAKIVFWIVWIGFIVSAVDTLQLAPFQGLVEEFFRFVPRFLVALLVLRSDSSSATSCGARRCSHRSTPGCPVRA